ncbi:MAG TPA: hypothetical protein VIH20_05560 [Candidatus Subteraquimicrobiales bacterium]
MFREFTLYRGILSFLSWLISAILSPFIVAIPLAFVVTQKASPSVFKSLEWLLISLIFAVLVPLGAILILRQRGEVTDVHLAHRLERPFPFLTTLFSGLLGTYFLLFFGAPRLLITLALSFIFLGISITFVTLYWKISAHLAGVAGALTAAFLIFGFSAAPLFLLLPVVGWARIYRKRHTLAQVIGGALEAIFSICLVFLARELI